jgi:large subunit ribosomal protein L14
MKSIKASMSKPLPIGASVICADNSGAKIIKVISVKGFKSRTNRLAVAGVGDLITANVVAGKPDMVHKVIQAVIIRQKQAYTRPDGTKVKFEDNAAVVIKDPKLGMPKGTMVKGPMAKEVAIRWSAVAKIASIIL